MNTLIAIMVGALAAAGVYCLLRRSIVKLIIGIMLLGQSVNLLIFSANGFDSVKPAIISAEESILAADVADPLPQALVLTAIVIGFGLTAFALALVYKTYRTTGHDDINSLTNTDTAKGHT